MFALSTSWNALRHSQAKDIILEIKALGFNQVELNFNLTARLVKEMIALKDRGQIQVVSVHNFCPIPFGTTRESASPDIYSLSSLDEGKRQKAVQYTKNSIDTAVRIGAAALVLHLGKVQIVERIKELARADQNKNKRRCIRLKATMQKEREKKARPFFDQALMSLKELVDYAQGHQVKLGIENRYYFSEIPSLEEMTAILDIFAGTPVYYWHDVGHAQVYENLGFLNHLSILDRFKERLCGIHLHDIEGISDHRAPLKGSFDFSRLLPYVNKDTLKVLEPHYPQTKQDIIRAKQYLEGLFAGLNK